MVAVIGVAALAVLALVTQAGVLLVQRAHPASGAMIEVAGASLHIVELGPPGTFVRRSIGGLVMQEQVARIDRLQRQRYSSWIGGRLEAGGFGSHRSITREQQANSQRRRR